MLKCSQRLVNLNLNGRRNKMAINDIIISELPELLEANITDDTIFSTVESGKNYKVKMGSISALALQHMYDHRPIGEMSLTTTSPVQEFDDTAFEVITAFDKIQFERGITVDPVTDSITIIESGNYKVSVTIVAEFDKAVSLDTAIMVDGVVNESFGNIQGLGNGKGVLIGGADIDPLAVGQIVQLAAKRGEAGTVDVVFPKVRLIVERV